MTLADLTVLIRGGGEMASGIAHRLYQCHMRILMTEAAAPTAVRRTVAFAEAVYEGSQTVEGVKAVRVDSLEQAPGVWRSGEIPIIVDPEADSRREIRPPVLIDAIMAKKNSSTTIADAPLVIGVGPGFVAGGNVHAVVESNRGYHLGRVQWEGETEANTGVPAPVAGHAEARVLRTPRNGRFRAFRKIGDIIQQGEIVGAVEDVPIRAQIPGLLRGLLRDGIQVPQGVKAGDVDPRTERGYCYLISDKARAIGGGVLEAILHSLKS
ncbi:MAG: selenium-dependent molybdenum cofactor biosynthesis protein YqeB [Candidatus Binatia bacterium]